MPLDLSEVVSDPDLAQAFTIIRTTGSFQAGGWVKNTPVNVPAFGIEVPETSRMLDMIPAGDRVKGSLLIFLDQPIFTTSLDLSLTSDMVQWHGKLYRVMAIGPWSDNGFWFAVLDRTAGA